MKSTEKSGKHVTIQLGVWTVVRNKASLFTSACLTLSYWNKRISILPWPSWAQTEKSVLEAESDEPSSDFSTIPVQTLSYLYQFVMEIYGLGPMYFYMEMFLSIWWTLSGVFSLYLTSRLLDSVGDFLEKQEIDVFRIINAIFGRVLLAILSRLLWRVDEKTSAVLNNRVTYHFLMKSMHTSLNFDFASAEDPEVRSKLGKSSDNLPHQDPEEWKAFREILDVLSGFLSIVFELSFMLSLSRRGSTSTLALVLCFVKPCLSLAGSYSLYSRSFVSYCSNAHFTRMIALHKLAYNKEFLEDRLSNNLDEYIEREFKHSREALGDTCTEEPYIQWWRKEALLLGVTSDLSYDIPLIFFALRVLWNSQNLSLSSLIILQQTSQAIHGTSESLLDNLKRVSRNLLTIRNLYTLSDIQNKVKDGEEPYLPEKGKMGSRVEFRNVSFAYPGTSKNALTDVSFTIEPGQLVVVVGVNGSGKSSTIKLLTRLHDPTNGQILLDGQPLPTYKLADVHRVTAILRQDHPVFPLSLRENVALGQPERRATDAEVQEALRQGSAAQFLKKLKDGAETVLSPVRTADTYFAGKTDAALKAVAEQREMKTNLSGGETQRLAASRTFLRLMSGNIRLLVADEPTSALDPEGEYELFSRLREHSGGKTVIFITHRFGHLTKYADLILCMKDGRLIEQGTHDSLMAIDGEYKRLHTVQAKAFVSG